jgi:phage-related protein
VKWSVTLLPEAEAELLTMPADIQAHFLHIRRLIIEFGAHQVGMPHIKHLEGKLWEMRMKGRDGIARAIYITQTGSRVTVLHVFTKKPQRTPAKALVMARTRIKVLTE